MSVAPKPFRTLKIGIPPKYYVLFCLQKSIGALQKAAPWKASTTLESSSLVGQLAVLAT